MALRNLRFKDDEILRKKCREVKKITPATLDLLDDMAETMYAANGVGIAAPQVGILKRIVVIDVGDGILEFINPVIINTEGSQETEEGCLSLPGFRGLVERPEKVTVKALNRDGEEFELTAEERLAVAVCHETDHLDGVLYIDKATDVYEQLPDDEYYDDEFCDEEL